MAVLISIIIGVSTGFLASYGFLILFLKRKKPKISISSHIIKTEIDGKANYLFKFVNNTKSEIYDINIEAVFYKPFGDISGKNLQSKDINLVDDFKAYMPCEEKGDVYNLHAMRLRTTDNLEEMWKDNSSYISLTVIAKHSLSGLNKVFIKEYLSKDFITSKKFQSGNNLEVK